MRPRLTRATVAICVAIAIGRANAAISVEDFFEALKTADATCGTTVAPMPQLIAQDPCIIEKERPLWQQHFPQFLDIFDRYARDIRKIDDNYNELISSTDTAERQCGLGEMKEREREQCKYRVERPTWARFTPSLLTALDDYEGDVLALDAEFRQAPYSVEVYNKKRSDRWHSLRSAVLATYLNEKLRVYNEFIISMKQRLRALISDQGGR
jgi:hypothetical protein